MIIRFFALVVMPLAVFLNWPELVSLVPEGLSRDWLPVFAVVLYGMMMMLLGVRPRVDDREAKLHAALDETRTAMEQLMAHNAAGFATVQEQVDLIGARVKAPVKGMISVEQLQTLQAFDPGMGTKVPQILALTEALSMVDWPDVDTARLESMLGAVRELKALQDAHVSISREDIGTLRTSLDQLVEVAGSIDQLLVDVDGNTRDWAELNTLAAHATEMMQQLKPLHVAMAQLDAAGQPAVQVIRRMDDVMEALGGLAFDTNGDTRDYDDLKTLSGNVSDTLLVVAELVKPANGYSESLPAELKVVGRIVEAIDDIVLDSSGDAIDFSEATDGVKSLEELTRTVGPLMQRLRQTT
ncbi:MAG: hypothetical protein EON60_08880 [Alphaproteobacteria bacterium]|nr:MAG: hypothetical protein EON60_08880 [Alphaproteobacteria bacterium]